MEFIYLNSLNEYRVLAYERWQTMEKTNKTLIEEQNIDNQQQNWETEFEDWWNKQGQFCRAGGGEYEKTFAYRAWEAATKPNKG